MMPDKSVYHLAIAVDCLTNSIRHILSGESLPTEVAEVAKDDLKEVTRKNNWHFNWKKEYKQQDRRVCKLVIKGQPEIIQGLLSLSEMEGYVYLHLAETAPQNFGEYKLHEGVGGGNLFAYCCKHSFDKGNEGFIAFKSKTKLIAHYEQALGAIHVGNHNMIIDPSMALKLINKYFKS